MMHGFKKKLLTALAIGAALTAPAVANTLRPQPDSLAQIQAEHVMLATADYDQTLAWYQENLGFRIKHEWTVPEFPDLQLAYIVLSPTSFPDSGRRMAFFEDNISIF